MASAGKSCQWIPTVYLMQGLPFALVTMVSSVLYKTFHFSNSSIAFLTSILMLPWTIKFFIAPALEKWISKKTWIILTQFIMASLTVLLGFVLHFSVGVYLSLFIFFAMALSSSIHDINSDGLYLTVLSYPNQAKFIGVRTVFYHLGKFIAQGGLLCAIGFFSIYFKHDIWSVGFFILGMSLFLLAWYNRRCLPMSIDPLQPETEYRGRNIVQSYQHVLQHCWHLPHLRAISIFILLYHFPESQLNKIFLLFMLDNRAQGGLGLSINEVGILYGAIAQISMLLGVTLSGFLLNRFTLKKCLIPFTIFYACSRLGYLILLSHFSSSVVVISVVVFLGECSFGLSNGAYMLYLIHCFAKGPYSMSLYAVGTTLMLLGMVLAGSLSGYLQTLLGYTEFFVWITIISFAIVGLAFYQVKKVI